MAIFRVLRGNSNVLPAEKNDGYAYLTKDTGKVYIDVDIGQGEIKRIQINENPDWNAVGGNAFIKNKPSIPKKISDLTNDKHFPSLLYNSVEEWNNNRSYIPAAGDIIVYSDYKQEDGKVIAGVKIGDGTTYVVDLPFLTDAYQEHINNSSIHITSEERTFWNNKVRCYLKEEDEENIIFTTN